ncbi:MAG: AmmeMemoRadiSam system protein B [Maioricimonas sp. JB049]
MCVRQPAVAGQFYPASAGELLSTIERLLDNADGTECAPAPKGLIAPHAGYVFSGPVAASGYRQLQPFRTRYRRVVLLGPSHHVAFDGLAASSADYFETPLGEIPVDVGMIGRLLEEEDVTVIDAAHIQEHSLEVHLPFMQVVIDEFTLVPLTIGRCTRHRMATLLETVWGGPETLIVISSDLSHYHPDSEARMLDAETSRAIEQLDPEPLTGERACGCVGIGGLIELARKHGLHIDTVDLRNSAQIVGRHGHVVGYGAYICH